jgi:hypothetical protein
MQSAVKITGHRTLTAIRPKATSRSRIIFLRLYGPLTTGVVRLAYLGG